MEAICVVNVPWQKEIQRMDHGGKLILLENISILTTGRNATVQ
jgi:hypothetical protein